MKTWSKLLVAWICLALAAACPVRDDGKDTGSSGGDGGRVDGGRTDGGNPTGLKVKDCQDTTSAKYPGANGAVNLVDVVVTSPLFSVTTALDGFFVADAEGGDFSGILVTVTSGEVVVALNDKVDIEGTLTEYAGQTGNTGTETQIAATRVTPRGQTTPVVPATVASNLFASDATAETYEGMLVKIENVSIVAFADGSTVAYGQFGVAAASGAPVADILIDDQLFAYLPGSAEVFASITGLVRYTYYGDYAILPRSAADVVSQSGGCTYPDLTIAQIQDTAAAGHPEVCATTALRCCPVQLTNKVVVSPVFGISREDTCLTGEQDYGKCPYYLYGMFVADPSEVDSNGRLKAYSGIQVTFVPGTRWIRPTSCAGAVDCGNAGTISASLETNYTFEGHFQPTALSQTTEHGFPAMGDIVTLVGEPAEYYDMTQLGRVTKLNRIGSTSDPSPVVTMPLPALFDGSVENIVSGMPEVTASQYNEARPALAPGVDTEKYEGVLIELRDVYTIDEGCVGYVNTSYPSNGITDFGYFRVAGDPSPTLYHGVEIAQGTFPYTGPEWGGWWRSASQGGPAYDQRHCDDTDNKCYDSRHPGQLFTSITGILNYSFGVHRLEPRNVNEIVCSTDCAADVGPAYCED
ncbi:MAG: hypothetical protein JXR83_14115 [Deltaproteobacteria bacterium]|nr:hypothetical protein [Deltaproteobacteria bacterium]